MGNYTIKNIYREDEVRVLSTIHSNYGTVTDIVRANGLYTIKFAAGLNEYCEIEQRLGKYRAV